MMLAIYLISIPAFYYAIRQQLLREDNKNKFKRENIVRGSYDDIYNSYELREKWTNRSMVWLMIGSLIPVINTFGALIFVGILFFTHEDVSKWFDDTSKL